MDLNKARYETQVGHFFLNQDFAREKVTRKSCSYNPSAFFSLVRVEVNEI